MYNGMLEIRTTTYDMESKMKTQDHNLRCARDSRRAKELPPLHTRQQDKGGQLS